MPAGPVETQYGMKMFVHPHRDGISDTIALTGDYEPAMAQAIQGGLDVGDVFIDVGAHIGFHTLVAAQKVGPSGLVHAFEPVPANAELLRRNVTLNGLSNVIVHEAAAWDGSASTLSINVQAEMTGNHSATSRAGRVVEVSAVTVDSQVAERPVGLAKIDVEGAEPQVIAGMHAVIAESPGIAVLLEFFDPLIDEAGTSKGDLFEELAGLGLLPEQVVTHHTSRPYTSASELPRFCNVLFKRHST